MNELFYLLLGLFMRSITNTLPFSAKSAAVAFVLLAVLVGGCFLMKKGKI